MPKSSKQKNTSSMDRWAKHKHLVDAYVWHYQRPKSQGRKESVERHSTQNIYKTERDILVENHQFLRSEEDEEELSWEKRVAKKYYDKLFKEYALVELKYYKEGRIALRWRNEKELFRGKGQFTCGSMACDEPHGLRSWEVNFGYTEKGEKKNALVKIRLCQDCSDKLNYKTKQKLVSSPHHEDASASGLSRSHSGDDRNDSLEDEDHKEDQSGEQKSEDPDGPRSDTERKGPRRQDISDSDEGTSYYAQNRSRKSFRDSAERTRRRKSDRSRSSFTRRRCHEDGERRARSDAEQIGLNRKVRRSTSRRTEEDAETFLQGLFQ